MEKNEITLTSREENLRNLKPEQVVPYLTALDKRLSNLSEILLKEKEEFVPPYIQIIRDAIECLKLKHELIGHEQIDFPLTIDPTDSGFPTIKDFYLLEKDKEETEIVLSKAPEREEIIESIRNKILKGRSPVGAQMRLRRFDFYSKLKEMKLFNPYHFNEPKFIEERDKKNYYILEWTCLERGINSPVLYRMYLTQDKKFPRLDKEKNYKLESIIYPSHSGRIDLRNLVSNIDRQLDEIHPKLIYKYIIGPYYNNVTVNSDELMSFLKTTEEQSVLKYSIEAVASLSVRKHGNRLRKLLGLEIEKEVYGPLDISDKRMIVPLKVKQRLGETDEYEMPCKIYGEGEGGDIIC